MKNLNPDTSYYDCITEYLQKTDKARHLLKTTPKFFSAKERQFFLLLSSDDFLSKKIKSHLLSKASLHYMLDHGLLEPSKSCNNYTQLLKRYKPTCADNSNTPNNLKVPSPMLQLLSGNV